MNEAATGLYLLLPRTPLIEDIKSRQKSKLNNSYIVA